MSEEDKKAIQRLEYINRQYDCNNYYSIYDLECIETILNLIQSQQEELEKNKRLFSIQEKRKLQLLQRKDKEIEKKDKIINEMAKHLEKYSTK